MIQMIFVALWICIFTLLCVAIRRTLKDRAREHRQEHVRSLRRFTHEYPRRRRSRRTAAAYQPAMA